MKPEAKILDALQTRPGQSTAALSMSTGLGSATLFPALQRLEIEKKLIISEWEDMPPPRRRLYRLAEEVRANNCGKPDAHG